MVPTLFESTELRWFLEGAPLIDARDLFRREPGAPEPLVDQRPDVYVCSTDEEIGVKIRGDPSSPKLEVKVRRTRHPVRLSTSAGFVESWVKWSWAGPEDPFPDRRPEAPWVRVEKVRYRWKFSPAGDSVRLAPGASQVEESGGVELTELRLDGRAWWTVAVEGFGLGDGARRLVERAAEKAVDSLPDFRGGEEESHGYPRWLALVRGRAA